MMMMMVVLHFRESILENKTSIFDFSIAENKR